MENDEKERKIMKKQRKILENEENVRKNEGKPMKNQGKVKEKVRKPCPRPKKIKFPKQEKKNSPKNSAPHVIYHQWIFCPPNFCSYRININPSGYCHILISWLHILFHGLNLFSVLKSGLNQIKSDPHIKPQIFDIYLVGPTRSSIR